MGEGKFHYPLECCLQILKNNDNFEKRRKEGSPTSVIFHFLVSIWSKERSAWWCLRPVFFSLLHCLKCLVVRHLHAGFMEPDRPWKSWVVVHARSPIGVLIYHWGHYAQERPCEMTRPASQLVAVGRGKSCLFLSTYWRCSGGGMGSSPSQGRVPSLLDIG